jgi:HEPN domain-containing protein
LLKEVAQLEPVYQETRYPDVSPKIPAEEFEKDDTSELMGIAERMVQWAEKKLK